MSRSFKVRDLHAASASPLVLAAQGFFWVGIERAAQSYGTVAQGQMYVEYLVPQELRHPWPIVMVHGGGGQGTDYLGTPDGRAGWAQFFVRAGYAVYVVDRPGHGRSPYHPDCLGPMTPPANYEFITDFFTRPSAHPERYPQAKLHSQWPGTGTPGDPALDQFLAGTGPSIADMAHTHLAAQRAGAELLDHIGPAILMTHSAAGPCGWMIADARPGLIKAIVAVEPLGPPWLERPGAKLSWGLTAAPITYEPAVTAPEELKKELRASPRPDLLPCYVQAEPVRSLPNLRGYPIVIVTAEASWMARDNHGIVDFLVQAGAQAEHLRLEDVGVHGNGHAMMLEKNSDEVAAALHSWIGRKGLNHAA